MALVLADRVQVTTSTTGTGTLTLGSAVTGFQDFTVIGDGNTTYYTITNSTAWEVGVGTYTSSGTTLARTTILSNSNGNTSPITLSGDSNVFVTYPAVAASDAAGDLLAANNLSDLASAATSRVNLGVETGTTGSSILPSGTTAERDGSPSAGYMRWNSTEGSTEVYDGSAWVAVGGDSVETRLCRAWVNFNGTGVVAIRASYNVSSITDNGTGNYTINFTTALPDANYSAVGSAGSANNNIGDRQLSTYPINTSSCKAISGQTASVNVYNADNVQLAIFR